MKRQYGYIIDKLSFNGQADDVQWNFQKINEDESVTDYYGIETSRDLSGDENIIIIGNAESFVEWIKEFTPPEIE